MAAELLKDEVSFVKNKYRKENKIKSVAYDIKQGNEELYVFPADEDEDNFYWADTIQRIVRGLWLSSYLTYNEKMKRIECRIY